MTPEERAAATQAVLTRARKEGTPQPEVLSQLQAITDQYLREKPGPAPRPVAGERAVPRTAPAAAGAVEQRSVTLRGRDVAPAISSAPRATPSDRDAAISGLVTQTMATTGQGYLDASRQVRDAHGAPGPLPTGPIDAVQRAMSRQVVPAPADTDRRLTASDAGLPIESQAWRALRQLGWLSAPVEELAYQAPGYAALPVTLLQGANKFRADIMQGKWEEAASALAAPVWNGAQDFFSMIGASPLTGTNVFTGNHVPTFEERALGTTPEQRGLTWGSGRGGLPAAWYNAANKVALGSSLAEDLAAAAPKERPSFFENPIAALAPWSVESTYRVAGALGELFVPTVASVLQPVADVGKVAIEGSKLAKQLGYARITGAWSGVMFRGADLISQVVADVGRAATEGRLGEAVRKLAPELQAELDALVQARTGKNLSTLTHEVDTVVAHGPAQEGRLAATEWAARQGAEPGSFVARHVEQGALNRAGTAKEILAQGAAVAGDVRKVLASRMNRSLAEAAAIHIGKGVWLPREAAKTVFDELDGSARMYGIDLPKAFSAADKVVQDVPKLNRWLAQWGHTLADGAKVDDLRRAVDAVRIAKAAEHAQAVLHWSSGKGAAGVALKIIRVGGSVLGKPLDFALRLGSGVKDWRFTRYIGKLLLPEGVKIALRDGPLAKLANNATDLAREVDALAGGKLAGRAGVLAGLAQGWAPATHPAGVRAQVALALEALAPTHGSFYGRLDARIDELRATWAAFQEGGFAALRPIVTKLAPTAQLASDEEAALGFLLRARAHQFKREAFRYLLAQGLAAPVAKGMQQVMEDIAIHGPDVAFGRAANAGGAFGYTESEFYTAARLFNQLGRPFFDTATEFSLGEGQKVWTYGVISQFVDDLAREGLAEPQLAKRVGQALIHLAGQCTDAVNHGILVGAFGTRVLAYGLGVVLGHPFTTAMTQPAGKALSMFGRMVTGGVSRSSGYRALAVDLTRRLEGGTVALFAEATTDGLTVGPRFLRIDEIEDAIRRLGVLRQTTPLHTDHLVNYLGMDVTSPLWEWFQKIVQVGDKLSFFRNSAMRVTQTGEIYGRVSIFLDEVERGASLEQAALTAREALYSLDNMTPVERTIFRRLFLFYSFQRADVANTAFSLLSHPGRVVNALNYFRLQPAFWGIPREEWAEQPGSTQYKMLLWMRSQTAALPRIDGSADPRKSAWMLMSPTVGPSSLLELWASPDPSEHFSPTLTQSWEQVVGTTPGKGFRDVFDKDAREMQIPAVLAEAPGVGPLVQWAFAAAPVPEDNPDRADAVRQGDRAPMKWVAGAAMADPDAARAQQRAWLLASGFGSSWVEAAKRLGRIEGEWRSPWLDAPTVDRAAALVGLSLVPLTKASEQRTRDRERDMKALDKKTKAVKGAAE